MTNASNRPLNDSFPDPAATADAKLAALQAEVVKQGERNTISVWRGDIVDATRLAVCLHLGILPQFKILEDDEQPPEPGPQFPHLILTLNQDQRAMAAAKLSLASPPQKDTASHLTIPQAAERFGVSGRKVRRARRVIASGYDNIVARCLLHSSSPRCLTISEAAKTIESLDRHIHDDLDSTDS